MSDEFEIPKWDIALEGLARETCQRLDRPLRLDDLRQLARQHAIRLDDIMVTLFQLVIHGQWQWLDAEGVAQSLEQETLDRLYVNRRLTEQDLIDFGGSWQPCQSPSDN
ncbi:hypothetical protein QVG61_13075 [Thiohalobacter sp. IOR34]|uniref:hypothetical protein n=1 Tax=Thiohalobacter sp. IOR34 TaxID=3057176 RepID=UPI0025B1D71E|nr:hypothetical protein [Thiohalobacter sp. IOR34]WJW75402.1 hypothetical protein QVG61_13075 [Thiohalobacter sp. IOR34]